MKKYTPRAAKTFAILSIISSIMLLTGIILIIVNFPNILLKIGLTGIGGLVSIIFLGVSLADKSRYLVIDADKIIFPRGADINGKMVLKRTVIKVDEIVSVKSKFHAGDKIISEDCFFYTLKLKDGTNVTFTLYAYGKEGEKEILDFIKSKIRYSGLSG